MELLVSQKPMPKHRSQRLLPIAVPLPGLTPRVGGGSAFLLGGNSPHYETHCTPASFLRCHMRLFDCATLTTVQAGDSDSFSA